MALFVKVFMLCLVLVLSCLNRAETLDRLYQLSQWQKINRQLL